MIVVLACAMMDLTTTAPTANAQTGADTILTEQQILEAFQRQKTRGLAIAPVGETTTTGAGSTTTVSTTAADIPIIPVEDQVNINIAFDFDSAALRDDQKPKLTALCGAMKSIDVQVFRILGHTDASGSEAYNQRLSLLRAEEVKRYLETDCGIASERMEAVGAGERFPLDPNDPRADANRRVEFQVLS